jgi:hypothetical protein
MASSGDVPTPLPHGTVVCYLCDSSNELGYEPPLCYDCKRVVCMSCSRSSPGWLDSDGKIGYMLCNVCWKNQH